VLLALQHNGFSSGLYTQLSIFNHSCDPNTIKFSAKCSAGGARMSECWTTRPVQEGEELTIDYCPTSTQLESRIYLHAQHGFVCACPVCQAVDSEAEEGQAGCIEAYEDWICRHEGGGRVHRPSSESEWGGKSWRILGHDGKLLRRRWLQLVASAAEVQYLDKAEPAAAVEFLKASMELCDRLKEDLSPLHPAVGDTCRSIADMLTALAAASPQAVVDGFPHLPWAASSVVAIAYARELKQQGQQIHQMYSIVHSVREAARPCSPGSYFFGVV